MFSFALPTPSQPLRQTTRPGWTLPPAIRQSGTWRETLPGFFQSPGRPRQTRLSSKITQFLLTFATGINRFCLFSYFPKILLKRWARDATVGAEGCPIGVQVCIVERSSQFSSRWLWLVIDYIVEISSHWQHFSSRWFLSRLLADTFRRRWLFMQWKPLRSC